MNIHLSQPECCQLVHNMIQDNGLANFCIISSNSTEVLGLMESINATYLEHINHSYEANYIYVLYNSQNQASDDIQNGVGSIFEIEQLTQELVDQMHQNGKIICVNAKQSSDFKKVYDLGIDMVLTEQPRKAHETLQMYHNKCVNKNETNQK